MNTAGEIVDSASSEFSVSRPKPLWSEQAPSDWWTGLEHCFDQLSAKQSLSNILSIGLSGQMHGATLLDKNNDIIRPAILWNDGRCEQECLDIEATVPNAREITGNIVMPIGSPRQNYYGLKITSLKIFPKSKKSFCLKTIYVFY
ncbi:FGGY family carbohydrate kinase [Psychrosphaera sp. G1-22]|uniref:FGGY family carbohydrate kinase n=1 Tax=Psychrosphaera algicola TaxID=3023714 RepID=A0ABT5F9F2_9GAMM|nr:FGGY family carbohydrate kinase [Psychrosphaera sp. G1-22]MDC2888165.1 FGGY family carbohydrate kinase [Psychrosphaera sp. G1-22]